MATILNRLFAVLMVFPSLSIAADTPRRTVSVNGDADVLVTPDVITITLGLETSSTVLTDAKAQNDKRTSSVIQTALGNSIRRDNIKTDYLHIEPRYRDWRDQDFLGYYVQRNLVIELKDVSKFETVISGLLESGANYVHGIDFRTSELRKHRDKARALAIAAAREKATALAGELGQRIGQPTSISESSSWWQSSYGGSWGSRGGANAAQNVVNTVQSSGGSGESGSTLEPGKIRVNAKVDVTFELETTGTVKAGI